jgi:hypothetical protein
MGNACGSVLDPGHRSVARRSGFVPLSDAEPTGRVSESFTNCAQLHGIA